MSLRRRKVLITSGPTRAPLDAVRFLSNKSTGRLGSLIAEAALEGGADVTFVYGRGSALPVVRGGRIDHLRVLPIDTVDDLVATFRQELPAGYDAVVHAMAVLDFAPAEVKDEKVSSRESEWIVRLVPTPKAASLVRELAPRAFFVGFKLEVARPVDELTGIAADWARRTRADLVVANDMRDIEHGIHTGYFVRPDGTVDTVVEGKEMIARALTALISRRLEDAGPQRAAGPLLSSPD